MGLWVIPYLLPAVVVRRPGAVMIASLIIGVISIFATPYGPSAIVGNVLGGLFVEVPLAIMLYRKWTWWAYLVSATVFGLLNGFLYASVLSTLGSADLIPVGVVTSVVSALAGGGICILLAHLLHRAGIAIDHDA
jgi:ABC transporter, permease protein